MGLILLATAVTQAEAESLQVIGYSGELGQWDLSASVTERTVNRTREFSGPLTMRHVGVCTQDGPEERTGEIRFQFSKFRSAIEATILIDGVECRYSGRLSDRYSGAMNCPDRPAVSVTIWLK
ncbi:hypothetical protein [Variovorax sp. RT4R15]|uniref:hypothetical protein n=1 Tax=Variovorax sp. RT4R15 TaxID=3443737 RepID=UPI003F498C47